MMVKPTIDAECDGLTLQKLAECIETRNALLAETASASVFATANTILRSLRSGTLVASATKDKVEVAEDPSLVSSWTKANGTGQRCIREGNKFGARFVPQGKVYYLMGKYAKGEAGRVFIVTIAVADDVERQFYVVADSEKTAQKWAKQKHKNIVNKCKGMAKFVLSYASYLVFQQGSIDATTNKANKIGRDNLDVNVMTVGYDTGFVSIEVADKLSYAALALKEGPAYLQTAIQKACNSTIGYINKKMDYPLSQKLDTPFPEVKAKK